MKTEERFLKYVSFPTMSDKYSGTVPSSEKQRALAEYVTDELRALGLENARTDCATGVVYAALPASPGCDTAPAIGLIAHLDTSPDAPDAPVRTKTVEYTGGDIALDGGEVMRAADFPCMELYRGQHMIVTDGKTLLGADDKAGIAAICTALERVITENLPHGRVCVAFTPDEEIGCGADHFDIAAFGADYAYTVDGGRLGELEYECFNAASAVVGFHGVGIHPGSAKGRMKNAALMAAEFVSLLPAAEIPACTEGYEGFYHLDTLSGSVENARAEYIIRDHDAVKFGERKAFFAAAVDFINTKYGSGSAECKITDSYRNMREIIEGHMYVVDRAREAMLAVGVTPDVKPIRGGTDGARLSYMGLPCPNLCTGGENFHSRFEFVTVEALGRVCDIVTRIITDAAGLK